jgi:uncharacterized oxidoreductase
VYLYGTIIIHRKIKIMQLSGNKILITGGASGIGLGLTERFVKEGNTVIICGRRENILQEAAEKFPGIIIKVCDLTLAEERENLFNWIKSEHSDLNILINNAGIQNWMNITDPDFMAKAKQEIAINIEAPLHLTNLFIGLPNLKTVMNVTSGLAFSPMSKVAVYSATKAFFHSFTLSAQYLLQLKGIEVIEIVPPALNTDLGGKGLHTYAPPVSDFIEAIFAQLKEGKKQLTFGMSETMTKIGAEQLQNVFNRMNT